jgi:hypothetical protein
MTTTNAEMKNIIRATFDQVLKLREIKGSEYSEDGDALSNFRRNAADMEMEMETVWRVYAGKHWDAISQHVRDIQQGRQRDLSEPMENRVDDLIVYLCLFKAMLRERGQAGGRQFKIAFSQEPA